MFFPTFVIAATIAGTFANDISKLMTAIERRNIDGVKALLNTVDVTSKDELGWNVLHAAAYSNGEITRLLISQGADRVVNDYTPYNIPPPLIHVCVAMYEYSQPHMYEIMEALLKAGGDPNVSNADLLTPLHLTTRGPETRLLISYGANVNAKDKNGQTPVLTCFSWLYRSINYEVLYALADGDADFAIANEYGDTIFHMKTKLNASSWTKEFVMFLAGNGVPLDALDDSGETALTKDLKINLRSGYFCGIENEILYDSLKDSFYAHMAEAGANLSAPNKRGETLLHIAVLKYCAGMAKWLLENGVNIEAKNGNGDSPLMALIKQEKWNYENSHYPLPSTKETDNIRAVIDVLINGGADVNFVDEFGRKRRLLLENIDNGLRAWSGNSLKKNI